MCTFKTSLKQVIFTYKCIYIYNTRGYGNQFDLWKLNSTLVQLLANLSHRITIIKTNSMFIFTESDFKSVAHLAVALTDITVMKNPRWPPPKNLFFHRYITGCHKIINKHFLVWFFDTPDLKFDANSTVKLIVTPNY